MPRYKKVEEEAPQEPPAAVPPPEPLVRRLETTAQEILASLRRLAGMK